MNAAITSVEMAAERDSCLLMIGLLRGAYMLQARYCNAAFV